MQRIVTGIQPSGTPHLGNHFGMIEPSLGLVDGSEAIYFVADLHALTTVRDPAALGERTLDVTATWLALGLDPGRAVLYRQSDLPEVCELTWILGCATAKGLLNRGHAYKAATDANRAAGRPPDDGITAGTYGYPLLMAADILIHAADVVPVGEDQRQHVEVTRDIAQAFNAAYGPVLTVPTGRTDPSVASVPGTDGRKMSKSYDNVVPIFGDRAEVTRRVMSITTDSRRPEQPKDPESCNVFALYRHLATADEVASLADRYRRGGVGYREVKGARHRGAPATLRRGRRAVPAAPGRCGRPRPHPARRLRAGPHHRGRAARRGSDRCGPTVPRGVARPEGPGSSGRRGRTPARSAR